MPNTPPSDGANSAFRGLLVESVPMFVRESIDMGQVHGRPLISSLYEFHFHCAQPPKCSQNTKLSTDSGRYDAPNNGRISSRLANT